VKRAVVTLTLTLALALPSAGIPALLGRSAVHLIAYGATRKAWAAHHVADPSPRLERGCCFLPKQADGQDRYYAVQYDQGRVFSYEMHFAPKISASRAKLVVRREVPPDARLVRHARRRDCEILQYRSAAARRALGSASVGVALYTNVASGRYRGVVGGILVGPYTVSAGC
jgi:hypothetical protein